MPRNSGDLLRRPGLWPTVLRAVWELALARHTLGRRSTRELLDPGQDRVQARGHRDAALPARVAWAIPRVAARMPWRANCLVQALAARRWLARKGVASDLCIGTRKDRPSGFEAHAWLSVNGLVLIGSDINDFVALCVERP